MYDTIYVLQVVVWQECIRSGPIVTNYYGNTYAFIFNLNVIIKIGQMVGIF